jgi:hypothetical protein
MHLSACYCVDLLKMHTCPNPHDVLDELWKKRTLRDLQTASPRLLCCGFEQTLHVTRMCDRWKEIQRSHGGFLNRVEFIYLFLMKFLNNW